MDKFLAARSFHASMHMEGAQTMTGYIAQIASGDAPQGSPVYYSLFAVGALLFVMTLVINLISIRLVRRYRQVY